MRREWLYEDFKRKIGEILKDKGVKFEYEEIKKLNDNELTGIIIQNMKNNSMIQTYPMIYLEPLYQEFYAQKDAPFLAVEKIKELYNVSLTSVSRFTLEDFMKPENIRMMVINKSLNKELLENLPHIEKEDLAIIYMCKEGEFAAKITYKMMKRINLTPNRLLEIAYENMKRDNYKVRNMTDILITDISSEQVEEINDFSSDLHVATNEDGLYGATAIMNKGLLQQFGREKGYKEFYILPSSIHEILIMPKNEIYNPKDLSEIVSTINNSLVVENEIILSDSIYLYKVEEGEFCIAYPK